MMMCEPCLTSCNAIMTQLTTTDAGLQQLMAAAQQAQQQMMPPAAGAAHHKHSYADHHMTKKGY